MRRFMNKGMVAIIFATILFPVTLFSQDQTVRQLQSLLDSLCITGNYPGLSLAVVTDTKNIALTSGLADIEKNIPLKTSDMLLQGSVGKTYCAAITMRLIKKGALSLDDKVSKYLSSYAWYSRVPNATDITIKMLMNHTSGVMRYEFKPAFTKDLSSQPDKVWTPEELIRYVLDEKADFQAGKGWDYSDTNYILLAMILEKVTGRKYYEILTTDILAPQKLLHTRPSDKRKLDGLCQGYAGEGNEFGGQSKVINDQGLFIINPQFEWTGGGVYSTTQDLAVWGKLLYEGKIFDPSMLPLMLDGVPAKLGPDSKYGLGVIMRPTSQGQAYGHSGFFPGYLTEMYYFPDQKICIALQSNSSDFKNLRVKLFSGVVEVAKRMRNQKN